MNGIVPTGSKMESILFRLARRGETDILCYKIEHGYYLPYRRAQLFAEYALTDDDLDDEFALRYRGDRLGDGHVRDFVPMIAVLDKDGGLSYLTGEERREYCRQRDIYTWPTICLNEDGV